MRVARVLVIGLAIVACGGSGEAATTQTSTQPPAATTATTAAPAATPAPTTTVSQAAVGGEDCLVGTWELDSEAFVAAIGETFGDDPELEGTTIEFAGGTNTTELEANGTFWNDRSEWSLGINTPDGAIFITMNGIDTGTWSVDGDQITMSDVDQAAVVKMQAEVDGELVDIPFGSTGFVQTDVWLGTATYTCSGDTLTVTADEGVVSVFERTG